MINKFRASHKLGSLNPQGKVTKADAGFTMMQNNSTDFPVADWPISPASVQKAITDLDNAITAAANAAPGTISHMHQMERVLIGVFNLLRSYVELTANNTSDPKTVIESAGMTAYVNGGAGAVSDLTLTAKGNGEVLIEVPRNKGEVAFVYEWSNDGGATWQQLTISKLATWHLTGQAAGTMLYFRFTPIAKIPGTLSAVKSIMVV